MSIQKGERELVEGTCQWCLFELDTKCRYNSNRLKLEEMSIYVKGEMAWGEKKKRIGAQKGLGERPWRSRLGR